MVDANEDLNRGIKRSRSPSDAYPEQLRPGAADDDKPRKRGRPMKGRASGGLADEPTSQTPAAPAPTSIPVPVPVPVPVPQAMPPHTPQSHSVPLPVQTPHVQYAVAAPAPAQASPPPPPKTTPKTTLKALPTVRDHTTDQLGPGNDEYMPREVDEAGEKKVLMNGQLVGPREYRCRTFLVPQRGDKLFMLATECARVLGYRDSYLLFNKNRSLYKIIASQVEKDDLVSKEILPFSYRSRQIAIVTARSMFRQFGSRVIVNGRRVRDDYWETKARKQGFTENDPAGEKRPGASRAREAAAEANQQSAAMLGGPQGEIVYSNNAAQFGPQPPLMQPGMIRAPAGQLPSSTLSSSTRMPVITLGSSEYADTRTRDYSNVLKAPRQEITGPPYTERTTATPITEMHAQAHHAAEYNRTVNHQREMRNDYMQSMWRRPHEQPNQPSSLAQPVVSVDAAIPTSRSVQPPHSTASVNLHQQQGHQQQQQQGQQQQQAPPPQQTPQPQQSQSQSQPQPQPPQQPGPSVVASQSPQMMMTAAPYSQPLTSQPTRLGSTGSMQQGAQAYNYPPATQMWPPTPQTPQYSYSHASQTSAHAPHQQPQHAQQQHHQPHAQHPSHQQHAPQPPSSSSQIGRPPSSAAAAAAAAAGQVSQQPGASAGGMPYSGMPGMSQGYNTAAGAPSHAALAYDQTPRQYMHQSAASGPAVSQGWPTAAAGQPQTTSQWWQAPQ